ncbi:AlpA family transcriptional regulator [uncultured Brevibacillus sp.]|uniref:helix-turn-helix transcriptional regulator n=1 Tax=uncultured Brevibacillus sp. TaxID=169970 RepID=UPI002597FEB1|nr:helix-turn-helix domain-containing protein [uncultured Brevibacillus sp.]
MNKELLTTKELCNVLKVSRRTIARCRKYHGLPHYLSGPGGKPRFDLDEVQNWMKNWTKKNL